MIIKTQEMKKTFLTLSLFLIGLVTIAQVSNGHIKYDIEVDSDEPMVASMMEGATMEMYFGDNNSKVTMNFGIMSTTVIYNDKLKMGLMLMDMMGSKIAVKMSSEDLEKAQKEQKDKEEKTTVTLTKEKKKVLGYKCKKAIVTDSEGSESIYWYTKKIKVNKTGQQNLNAQVPGMPLIMIVDKNGMHMTMTASEVKTDKVADKEFDIAIPEGYDEMTMEELEQMGQ